METERSSLRAGDRVTAMGILGEVVKFNDDNTVILKMYDGALIEVLRQAITQIQKPASEKVSAPKEAATS